MNRLFNNTIFSALDYIVLMALNLVATPILIRHFGIDGYGAFVFLSIFSIYGMLSFFDLGMEGSLMNYVARFEASGGKLKLQDTLSIALLYYGVLGVILGIVIYFSGGLITSRLLGDHSQLDSGQVTAAVGYVSINIVIQFLTLPFGAVTQGLRRFSVAKSINSSMNIIRYVLLIGVAIKYQRIDLAMLVVTCLSGLTLLTYIVIFFFGLQQFRGMRPRFDLSLLRQLFSYSTILFVSKLIGLVCNQIDKFLIWLLQAVANMTTYDVVSRPANMLRLVLSVLNSATIPEVARLHQLDDDAALKKLFVNLVRYAYLILFPLVAGLYVFMDKLLGAWVGQSFASSSPMALVLLSVYLVLPIPSIASTMVVGMEKVRQTIWISIAYTVVKVVLSLILLKFLGLIGLMIGTLGAEIFYLAPYTLAMRRFLGFDVSALVRPLWGIAGISVAAVALHLLVRLLFADNLPAILIGAGLVTTGHALINYRFLLYSGEREFLNGKVRSVLRLRSGGARV